MMPDGRGLEFLAVAMALACASVDRLNQIPARLAFLFDYNPSGRSATPAFAARSAPTAPAPS